MSYEALFDGRVRLARFARLACAVLVACLVGPTARAQDLRWISQFGTSGTDEAWSLAADGAGGFYAVGQTSGSLGGPNAGSVDVWLSRHGSAGGQQWILQLGSPASDGVRAVVSDVSGSVIAAGSTKGDLAGPSAGLYDVWIARYEF